VSGYVESPYWPAKHSAQLLLASKLHEPAAHCPLHELLIEPPVPNRPAAQSAHAVWPVSLWCLPFTQAVQWPLLARAIATSPIRPAAHELQVLTPAALYWPSGHSLHAVDSVMLALNCPAVHATHCEADALAAYLPPSHCSQSVALAPLYLPAGHASHDSEPSAGWCWPAAHASQYVMLADDWYLPASHPTQWATDTCDCTELPY
jgi:hypothetical protein